jgi:molybdopterin-guanine dinucleotide biosynthesis protein A
MSDRDARAQFDSNGVAKTHLTGAVLVGGRSRRMGQDKALLGFLGGQPLAEMLVGELAGVCDEVLLVGGDRARFALQGARWVPDPPVGSGPVAGILSALEAARYDFCLVLACDMPLVSRALLQALASEPRDYDVLGYPRASGIEPLLAIYRQTCIPVLRGLLAEGELRAGEVAARVRTRPLPPSVLAEADPDSLCAVNVNTAAELEEVRALALGQRVRARPGVSAAYGMSQPQRRHG